MSRAYLQLREKWASRPCLSPIAFNAVVANNKVGSRENGAITAASGGRAPASFVLSVVRLDPHTYGIAHRLFDVLKPKNMVHLVEALKKLRLNFIRMLLVLFLCLYLITVFGQ